MAVFIFSRSVVIKFICLVLFFPLHAQTDNMQGLLFTSNTEDIEKRTSWEVFAKKTPSFSNELMIEFELSIIQPHTFGNVFRLTDKEAVQKEK